MANVSVSRSDFLVGIAAAMVAPVPVEAVFDEVTFGVESVRTDLNAVWSTLLDVGAKPFASSNRAAVEATLTRVRATITQPMNARSAYLTIGTLLGALNDGHVSLGFPEQVNATPRAFPLRFAMTDDDGLAIARDATRSIPIGSRLVAVDDLPASHVLETFRAVLGGQTPALRRARVTGSGAWPSIALFGFGPHYSVRYLDSGGSAHTVTLETVSNPVGSVSAPNSLYYTYASLRDGRVGYIDYRSCTDLLAFETFLAHTFATIASTKIEALIIDIRKNGGGDSRLNDALWPYVSRTPFKQFGAVLTRVSDRIKRAYGKDRYIDTYGDDAWTAPDGTLLESRRDPDADLIIPGRQPLRFTGPTYLLTSASTFSSGMSCALAAKDYGLATIVGEETGEPVNSAGEVYTFVTPAVGLQAYLTTKYFLGPKTHPDGQGVVPDIEVETTVSDVAVGRDPVLARVFTAIDARQHGG